MPGSDRGGLDAPGPRELLIVTAIFAVLTAVLTYPVDAGRVLMGDNPDTHLFLWTLGWVTHAMVEQPFTLFDANIFHPLSNTLAFSENLIGSALLAAPVIWLTGNHILALNVVSLLTIVLGGAGAYFLARRLGFGTAPAFVCGLVFAFSPARFFRTAQIHVASVQWMPFALAYLHTYLERRRSRDLKIAAALFTLQALTSGHGAVFLAVAMAVVIGYGIATGISPSLTRWIRDLGFTGVALIAPAGLVALPYRLVQQEMGLRRTLENWEVPPVSYIASVAPLHQAILNLFVPVTWVNETAHAYLFPGFGPIILGLGGIALLVARKTDPRFRHQILGYSLLLLVSLLLVAGRPLSIWPLVYWLPGFNFIRVPSRFIVLTVLALAVLSAATVEWLQRQPSARARGWSMALIVVLILAECAHVPGGGAPFSLRPAAADRWLADQRRPFVVAEVPNEGRPRQQSLYMLHSMAHWQKTVHGFSGIDPPHHYALYEALRDFPDPAVVQQLRDFGVTFVVVHVDQFDQDRWGAVDDRLSRSSDLELVFQEPRSRVYRITQ